MVRIRAFAKEVESSKKHGTKIIITAGEKRAKPTKHNVSMDVMDRIRRAVSQRLYLVKQDDASCDELGFCRKYTVSGTTGNVYDIQIAQIPSCSCPDFAKGRLCKHIIFVMVKVLHVHRDSVLVFQQALLQSELSTIFSSSIQYDRNMQATREVTNKALDRDETNFDLVVDFRNEKVPEGDCPVCFEDLAGNEALDSCGTCFNYIHTDCLKMWLEIKSTCCYCRTDWIIGSKITAAIR
jgi:hypothetical protein